MKITIEAETQDERQVFPAPIMHQGLSHCGAAGFASDGLWTWFHGNPAQIIGVLTCAIEQARAALGQKVATAGFIDAHNILVEAQRNAALSQAIIDNGRGLRIAKP